MEQREIYVKAFLDMKNLGIDKLREMAGGVKYKLSRLTTEADETGTLIQIINNDKLIRSQLPATMAIKATTDEEKDFVRMVNRTILPQDANLELNKTKLNKKSFSIKVEGKTREIECLFVRAKPETAQRLATTGMLVPTDNNRAVLDVLKTGATNLDTYFIRRRGQDQRWYCMLQCEPKVDLS